jgi:hypothetical protein
VGRETMSEYARIHYEARKALPKLCAKRGATERLHCALPADAVPQQLKTDQETGCKYSLSIRDYETLCVSCHRQQDLVDGRPRCAKGHEYTPDNTRMKNGGRICRACHREREAERNQTPEGRAQKAARDKEYRQSHPSSLEQKQRKLAMQRKRRAAAANVRRAFSRWRP